MLKNPFLNALFATGYIVSLVLIVHSSSSSVEDSVFAPIIMLSLLVLSVSVMALLFFYEPVRLLIEKDQRGALMFLIKTLVTFASLTALIALIFLFSSNSTKLEIKSVVSPEVVSQ